MRIPKIRFKDSIPLIVILILIIISIIYMINYFQILEKKYNEAQRLANIFIDKKSELMLLRIFV